MDKPRLVRLKFSHTRSRKELFLFSETSIRIFGLSFLDLLFASLVPSQRGCQEIEKSASGLLRGENKHMLSFLQMSNVKIDK